MTYAPISELPKYQQIGLIALSDGKEFVGSLISKPAEEVYEGNMHWGHYFWVVPANTLASLFSITLAPLYAVLNLLAAAAYGIASLASRNEEDRLHYDEMARRHGINAGLNLSFDIGFNIAKIAQPHFDYNDALETTKETVIEAKDTVAQWYNDITRKMVEGD
jgi:hypothetical protein